MPQLLRHSAPIFGTLIALSSAYRQLIVTRELVFVGTTKPDRQRFISVSCLTIR